MSVQITSSGPPSLGQSGYSLTCDVTGAENLNSSITYQWTKDNGTQTQIQVGGDPRVLSFSPLRLSDAGQYTCQVTVSSPYQDVTFLSEFSSVFKPLGFALWFKCPPLMYNSNKPL